MKDIFKGKRKANVEGKEKKKGKSLIRALAAVTLLFFPAKAMAEKVEEGTNEKDEPKKEKLISPEENFYQMKYEGSPLQKALAEAGAELAPKKESQPEEEEQPEKEKEDQEQKDFLLFVREENRCDEIISRVLELPGYAEEVEKLEKDAKGYLRRVDIPTPEGALQQLKLLQELQKQIQLKLDNLKKPGKESKQKAQELLLKVGLHLNGLKHQFDIRDNIDDLANQIEYREFSEPGSDSKIIVLFLPKLKAEDEEIFSQPIELHFSIAGQDVSVDFSDGAIFVVGRGALPEVVDKDKAERIGQFNLDERSLDKVVVQCGREKSLILGSEPETPKTTVEIIRRPYGEIETVTRNKAGTIIRRQISYQEKKGTGNLWTEIDLHYDEQGRKVNIDVFQRVDDPRRTGMILKERKTWNSEVDNYESVGALSEGHFVGVEYDDGGEISRIKFDNEQIYEDGKEEKNEPSDSISEIILEDHGRYGPTTITTVRMDGERQRETVIYGTIIYSDGKEKKGGILNYYSSYSGTEGKANELSKEAKKALNHMHKIDSQNRQEQNTLSNEEFDDVFNNNIDTGY